MHRHNHRTKNSGFTLTEIAIVLGIAGFIIAAIWVAASAVDQRQSVKQAVDTLQTITHNIVSIYQNRNLPVDCPAGSTQITSSLIDAGYIPASSYTGDAAGCKGAGHPWAETPGALTVYNVTAINLFNSFRVSFYNVPLDACIALLLQATNCDPAQPGCPSAAYTNWTANGVTPNAGPPQNWQEQTTATTGMDPTQASTLCGFNAFPGAGNNSVEFDYRL